MLWSMLTQNESGLSSNMCDILGQDYAKMNIPSREDLGTTTTKKPEMKTSDTQIDPKKEKWQEQECMNIGEVRVKLSP